MFEAPYLLCFKHIRRQCFDTSFAMFLPTLICYVWIHSLAMFETYCVVWSKHILCHVLNTFCHVSNTFTCYDLDMICYSPNTFVCYSFNMLFVVAWTHYLLCSEHPICYVLKTFACYRYVRKIWFAMLRTHYLL